MSAAEAIKAVDAALQKVHLCFRLVGDGRELTRIFFLRQCRSAMETQRLRGREHLPVFQNLRQRFNELLQQRRLLQPSDADGVEDPFEESSDDES